MTEEQDKKQELQEEPTKPEQLKEELTEEELKGVDGGDRNHYVMYGYSKKIKTQEPSGATE